MWIHLIIMQWTRSIDWMISTRRANYSQYKDNIASSFTANKIVINASYYIAFSFPYKSRYLRFLSHIEVQKISPMTFLIGVKNANKLRITPHSYSISRCVSKSLKVSSKWEKRRRNSIKYEWVISDFLEPDLF